MIRSTSSVFALLRNFSAIKLHARCASSSERQSKMLKKLMQGKKKIIYKTEDSFAAPKTETIFTTKKTPTKISSRRTAILNKMFMRHVSDLIASGPIGFELSGLGLEITGIKVCQHYHGLNIFWTATATDDFDLVERKLASITRQLRHELHQMQVMGNVPHLTFVRDYQLTYFEELDIMIEKADYGDNYKPSFGRTKTPKNFRTELENEIALKEQTENEVDNISSIPAMRHDVFGLDHALIMGRVKQAMAKSKQAWMNYEQKQSAPNTNTPFSFSTSFESIRQEQMSEKDSGDVLKDFLQKRKLLRKLKRAESAEFNSKIMDEEEWFSRRDDETDFDHSELIDEEEEQRFYDQLDQYEK